ncbi:hypothetical protein AB0N17_41355 [Streptomyces sp. NPDC051133]|uniref:hypothetical protein n=1 Tax=Streptomyces sp. NPDC051133 TaxID=3155521 RepID=UPI003428FF2E
MADDDAGGTVLGFPGGLTIPGPVGSGPPPPGAAALSLSDLPELAPPPSLLVAGDSDVSGGSTTTAHADPGMPDRPEGQGIAAMSVVMMAGITVAAMRGAWNAAAYLKARHEHHRAIADQQRAAADKASIGVEAARQKSRLPPGPEFGRSTRTSGGGGGRTNSGKSSTPNTFRSSGGSKPPGGSGSKTPNKAPGGGSGGRTPSLGTGGRGGGGGGRRGALESSGTKGGGNTGNGGRKTSTTGTKNNSGSLSGAVRDRAADRIRNGPKPKNSTGTLGTGKSGSGGGTTPSSGSKSGRGPGSKSGTSGSKSGTTGTKSGTSGTGSGGKGRVTLPEAVAKESARRLKRRRKRLSPPVLTTVRKGKGKKGAGKSGSGGRGPKRKGKGRVTLPAAIAKESARRMKKRRKRLDPPVLTTVPKKKGKKGKKPAAAGTTPTTPKVNLTKKPKPGTPGAATPKVSLTKKPKPGTPGAATPQVSLTKKPKPGTGGAAGTGGTAPKVNLRKKVRLTKKPRKPGSGTAAGSAGGTSTTRPKPTGPGATPKPKADKRRSRRGWWERSSARRSGRPAPDPSSSTSSGTTPGPGPGAASGGGFGPPPGWGYAQGTTITVEQVGGEGWTARREENRRAARIPAGAIPASRTGGTGVTVPVPAKAPNTQYADSDLTIYDVIESDADMAEEIMAGVDEANAAAEGCDKMMTRLEALHTKIVELKVPGVLEGWVLILAEKAVSVKAKAEALAEKLPAASEAIRTAGENAERRHKPLADAVRDAGHAAPAERDYHVE